MKMQILPNNARFREVDVSNEAPKSQEQSLIDQWGSSKVRSAKKKEEKLDKDCDIIGTPVKNDLQYQRRHPWENWWIFKYYFLKFVLYDFIRMSNMKWRMSLCYHKILSEKIN